MTGDVGQAPVGIGPENRAVLAEATARYGTPAYVYFMDRVRARFDVLQEAFDGLFGVSYAVKCNPNHAVLEGIRDKVETLDCSSIGEVERALAAGYSADHLTFSGPAKREAELARAVEVEVAEMVCESLWEMETLNRMAAAAGKTVTVFPRINPARMPRNFGVNMAGRASQFGIDEEDLDSVLDALPRLEHLRFGGFHIYSGTNSLSAEAIAENFAIFAELFTRFARSHDLTPNKLIFGSGFGIPYLHDDEPLDIGALAKLIKPIIAEMRTEPRLADARLSLEMGRWLIGSEGVFLTSVINEKDSRGTAIRMCDAGFNAHLSACGMMGTVIRRNWRIWKVSEPSDAPLETYTLVGPLCTTIDAIASKIQLPRLFRGDVIAIEASGAYGFTASPTQFISQPVPREIVVEGPCDSPAVRDVSQPLRGSAPLGEVHGGN
jgi:diaminopimelate decarboxylase